MKKSSQPASKIGAASGGEYNEGSGCPVDPTSAESIDTKRGNRTPCRERLSSAINKDLAAQSDVMLIVHKYVAYV